ncbi:MAG TPA: phasin family protein [Geminicoccaceae bacterium]
MANSKGRGAADQTASAAGGVREGVARATDTAGNGAGVASERTQHAVDEWTRGVQEGLTRYQEMFSRLPGFGVNGAEGLGETRTIAREQLAEFNTELLSYAQGTLNEAFEASKAVINAADMQEAMQVQVSFARKAMQDAVEQARKVSELYARASREVAKPMSRGMHNAAEPKAGRKGADDSAKQARRPG